MRNTERQRENEDCWQQPAKSEEQEQGQQAVALLKGPELLLEGRHMSGHLRHRPVVPENTQTQFIGSQTYIIRCICICPRVTPVELGDPIADTTLVPQQPSCGLGLTVITSLQPAWYKKHFLFALGVKLLSYSEKSNSVYLCYFLSTFKSLSVCARLDFKTLLPHKCHLHKLLNKTFIHLKLRYTITEISTSYLPHSLN